MFGSGTSPAIAGDLVILNRDEQNDPRLIAFSQTTGGIVWNTPQPPASELGATSYSTPIIWKNEVVIHRTGEIVAYSLKNGERAWTVSALSMGTSTPVIAEDLLFVGTWTNFGEPELRVDLPEFQTLVGQYDKDGDKQISKQEFPGDLVLARRPEVGDLPGGTIYVRPFFYRIDLSKDEQIDEGEWKQALVFLLSFYKDHGLMAIKAGAETDQTVTSVAWKVSRDVPEVPSPLYYSGCVYMVKNGGVITCMNAQDGTVLYRERLEASGPYYSSPIVAGDRIYTASAKGVITVLPAGKQFQVLARNDLTEPVFATPAAVENTLYVRSSNHIYAFAERN
jgi:outer membrane protein assembly factor BamB